MPALAVLAVAFCIALIVAFTGIALEPGFPSNPFWGQWTADLDGGLAWYRGRVLSASIGDIPLPSTRLDRQTEVHARLAAGDPLRVTAVAGPWEKPERIAPIFSIYDDRQREMLLIGPRRGDLVLRYRTRGSNWGFEKPSFTVPGMYQGLRIGDTLRLALWRTSSAYCLRLDARTACNLKWNAADGWSVLKWVDDQPGWVYALLGALWLGGLAGLVAIVASPGRTLIVGGAAVAAVLALVPPTVGLGVPGLTGWAGAAMGFGIGWALRRWGLPLVAH